MTETQTERQRERETESEMEREGRERGGSQIEFSGWVEQCGSYKRKEGCAAVAGKFGTSPR